MTSPVAAMNGGVGILSATWAANQERCSKIGEFVEDFYALLRVLREFERIAVHFVGMLRSACSISAESRISERRLPTDTPLGAGFCPRLWPIDDAEPDGPSRDST